MKKLLSSVLLVLAACEAPDRAPSVQSPRAAAQGEVAAPPVTSPPLAAEPQLSTAAAVEDPTDTANQCRAEYERLSREPGLAGTPRLDDNRASVLGRVKAEPALFVRKPEFDQDVSRDVRRYRGVLTTTAHPWDYLRIIVQNFTANPKLGRETLLREGYLYADDMNLAYALVDHVRAHHLFSEPRIWLQRGETTFHARRNEQGVYVYEDGPSEGSAVQLLLFDRVGVGEPGPAVHRDVRALRYRLHFDRIEPVRSHEERLVARLHYGSLVVPTILRSDGPHLTLECEVVEPEQQAALRLHREREERRARVLDGLRGAMLAEVDERLPFDEPRTEAGQQDGALRQRWLSAYAQGASRYDFNGDEYSVFDPQGRPLVPQVCVDFLTDTLERASGTWWRARGEPRQRLQGKLDFASIAPELPRRVPDFVEFTRGHPEWFEVYDTPASERIRFRRSQTLYRYLQRHADRYRPGDIVIIRGYTPFERVWEPRVMHYHSFFIYESDPVTALPILLVGNPGPASIRTWEFEIRRTPKRSIWHRIRPRLEWLEEVIPPPTKPLEPPPLTTASAL